MQSCHYGCLGTPPPEHLNAADHRRLRIIVLRKLLNQELMGVLRDLVVHLIGLARHRRFSRTPTLPTLSTRHSVQLDCATMAILRKVEEQSHLEHIEQELRRPAAFRAHLQNAVHQAGLPDELRLNSD